MNWIIRMMVITVCAAGLFSASAQAKDIMTTIQAAADDEFVLFLNGKKILEGVGWGQARIAKVKLSKGDVLAVVAKDKVVYKAGFILSAAGASTFVSDTEWKSYTGKELPNWNQKKFDDSAWQKATSYGVYGEQPWGKGVKEFTGEKAHWIWSGKNETAGKENDPVVYFRKTVK
ncbi:MAG: hypothetical protein AB1659_08180 [Thermodesulfobacteriota bacterium]